MDIQAILNSAFQDARQGPFGDAEKKFQSVLNKSRSEKDRGTARELLGAVYAATGNYPAAAVSHRRR